MKIVEIDEFGDADVLQFKDIAMPAPGRGEVLIKVAYAGVNYTDIYRRNGDYVSAENPTPLPRRLGIEGSGIVAAVGDGVTALQSGDRVGFCRTPGSYAEYIATPAERVVKLPDAISMEVGASFLVQGITAHYLTHSAFPLEPGHICLAHAGAGGVGQFLIQIAKMRGATVITTVGSKEKDDVVRGLGADHAILYREEDFRGRVMEITDGRGVDVVYDSVGRDTIEGSLRSLRIRGYCICYGHASGKIEGIDPIELADLGSIFFTRSHAVHYQRTPEEFAWRLGDVMGWLADGTIRSAIDRVFPFDEAGDAQRYMEARKSVGKVLLEIAAPA